ncbi:MAG: hypothetical protein ACOCVF_00030 [bacterium]
MEVLWKSLESEKTERMSKIHAYVPKISAGGNKRNITLCGRFRQIGDDGKAELFDNMDGDVLLVADVCKTCLKRYAKLCE